jgi:hypothetical protein
VPWYTARNPNGVFEKIDEARSFLSQVRACQTESDTWNFKCSLSGFLTSFRTSADRLIGATDATKGEPEGAALRSRLKCCPNIAFLRDRTDIELHGDGAVVWPRYRVTIFSSPGGRFYRGYSRWGSRFESANRFRSRLGLDGIERQLLGWRFDGSSMDLVELCEDSLRELESIARLQFGA